jgi:hypothetical protein
MVMNVHVLCTFVLLLGMLGCGGLRPYRIPAPEVGAAYKEYRYGKCEAAKINRARVCMGEHGVGSSECALYWLRCTQQNWNGQCVGCRERGQSRSGASR